MSPVARFGFFAALSFTIPRIPIKMCIRDSFAAPPERELDWSDAGVEGSYRFLNRVYRLVYEFTNTWNGQTEYQLKTDADKELNYVLHTTIKKVTEDVGGRFSFNTAISSIMELVNELYKYKELETADQAFMKKACLLYTSERNVHL